VDRTPPETRLAVDFEVRDLAFSGASARIRLFRYTANFGQFGNCWDIAVHGRAPAVTEFLAGVPEKFDAKASDSSTAVEPYHWKLTTATRHSCKVLLS
jgi:hypothetical protein